MARAPQRRQAPVRTHPAILAVIELLKTGELEQAEAKLAAFLLKFPDNSQAHALRGDALRRLERFETAIEAYQKARDAGMQSTDLHINLASCLIKQARLDEAQALAEEILQRHPGHAGGLTAKGDVHRRRAEPLAARDCYRQALLQRPGDAKLHMALAHLEPFMPDSPAFEALHKHLQTESLTTRERANVLATLGKASLDIGDDEQAFEYYQKANQLMDESLPAIREELERLLSQTRYYFTPSLFKQLSPHGVQSRPQIIVAGMSRSGKSLVESLFRGVAGVSLGGEDLLLGNYRKSALASHQNRVEGWLAAQTPDSIQRDAQAYAQALGDDGTVKITTVPGDLWNLGFIGLWLPQVPIIFCVRDVLDLGVTGYFQQYEHPEGYRYSYNQHQLGRQIACSEKVMEHWAQVLPNPVYLVDYEALARDPQTVMNNLLSDLGLKREQAYEDIVGGNARLLDAIGPIVSTDAPMPITDRFVGIGERFRDKLEPMIQGYHTIVDAFPRLEPPATLPQSLPDTFVVEDHDGPLPSESVEFDWQLTGQVVALDNGGQLLRSENAANLMAFGAFGLVAFDPGNDIAISPELQQNAQLQVVPGHLLGDGQAAILHACLDAKYNSTLEPLPAEQLPVYARQAAMMLAKLPIQTVALDSIGGLNTVDWLILDERHDSMAILEHGQRVLADTLLLQTGIAFQTIYQRQPNLAELSHWASHNGFRFYRFVAIEHSQSMPQRDDLLNQPAGTELRQAAALFIPSEARMANLSDAQRLKFAFLLDTVYDIHDLSYDLLRQVGEALGDNYLKARGYFDRKRHGPGYAELTQTRHALQSGSLSAAQRQIKDWMLRYPNDAQVRRLYAEHASWAGQPGLAIPHINKAIEQASEDLSVRQTGVEILLRAGMWWEAASLADALRQRMSDHTPVQRLWWEALAAQPEPDSAELSQALDLSSMTAYSSAPAQAARELAVEGRLLAHAGKSDQSLERHDQAFSRLEGLQGPVYAELLMAKADSLRQAGLVEESCDVLWEACTTYPYSPYTVHAYQKLVQRLGQCARSDLLKLAALHQSIQTIWGGYKAENLKYSFGDFGLPYQGFEPLRLPGSRPAIHRLGIYALDDDLPPHARALDIGCNHGFLLMGLAPHLSYGMGFDISQSCVDVGNTVAQHMGYEHIQLSSKPFDEFVCKEPFDLVIACAVHHWIGIPLTEFGAKLFSYCKPGGIVLLESQGIRSTTRTEVDFDTKAATIANAGFEVIRKGDLCDDGINYREFWVLRRNG